MLKGMGISDGIGIGKAIILNNEDIKTEKIRTDNTKPFCRNNLVIMWHLVFFMASKMEGHLK